MRRTIEHLAERGIFVHPPMVDEQEIAELTGKEHKHVLRDIRTMIDALRDGPNLDHLKEIKDSRGYTADFQITTIGGNYPPRPRDRRQASNSLRLRELKVTVGGKASWPAQKPSRCQSPGHYALDVGSSRDALCLERRQGGARGVSDPLPQAEEKGRAAGYAPIRPIARARMRAVETAGGGTGAVPASNASVSTGFSPPTRHHLSLARVRRSGKMNTRGRADGYFCSTRASDKW